MRMIYLFTLFFGATSVYAGQVTLPHTFVSGTAASAAEVNANFNAIKTSVDDNDGRITSNVGDIRANAANIAANTNAISSIGGIGVFVDGARVGSLLNLPPSAVVINADFLILLQSNYLARVKLDGTGLSRGNYFMAPYFVSNNCTGQSYVEAIAMSPFVQSGQGQIFPSLDHDPAPYRYVRTGTPQETIMYNSKNIGALCQSESGTMDVYKSYPNDPNITGVTGAEFTGSSITIAH